MEEEKDCFEEETEKKMDGNRRDEVQHRLRINFRCVATQVRSEVTKRLEK